MGGDDRSCRYVDTRSEREAAEVHRMFRERLAEQNSEHNGVNTGLVAVVALSW